MFTKGNLCQDVFRVGKILTLVLTLFFCVSCTRNYCPSYSSTSYNRNFHYAPEKHLTYKPVKVNDPLRNRHGNRCRTFLQSSNRLAELELSVTRKEQFLSVIDLYKAVEEGRE